ncbi:7291_t:CDS:2 [Gigaspora rosea]|nr:7291_t:CDS:2 [Gigaspora rosea]
MATLIANRFELIETTEFKKVDLYAIKFKRRTKVIKHTTNTGDTALINQGLYKEKKKIWK